jgi:hypothetical protein
MLGTAAYAQIHPEVRPAAGVRPITAEVTSVERERVGTLVLAHPQVRQFLAGEAARLHYGPPEYDKAEVEAYIHHQTDRPPVPRVRVLAVGRTRAAVATVSLSDQRVLEVRAIAAADAPLFDEDVDEALALVRASGPAKEAVGPDLSRFQPAHAGQEYPPDAYVAEPLPLRSSSSQDVCSRNRCLDLIFRTPRGYLPLRVQVDLTARSASPVRAMEEGSHH